MDHATDAFVEVRAKDLKQAFSLAADSVIDLTLDKNRVEEKDSIEFSAKGKDLNYLLFSWLEEVVYVLITEGFAIAKIEFTIHEDKDFTIEARATGEPLNFEKHNFKVEIKAPTFYEMKIEQNNGVYMRFLLDL